LFRPIVTERDALEGIDNQIELLRTANSTPNGYFALIDKGNNSNNKDEEEEEELLSEYQVWLVRQKITVLTLALLAAKETMQKLKNWNTCCEDLLMLVL
jgi:hypothetical protein